MNIYVYGFGQRFRQGDFHTYHHVLRLYAVLFDLDHDAPCCCAVTIDGVGGSDEYKLACRVHLSQST